MTAVYTVLSKLFDEGSFVEFDKYLTNGEDLSGVVSGHGLVNGCPAYAYIQDSDVHGGAMNTVQCKKIQKIYKMAAQNGEPVVAFFDSKGVKLDEGSKLMDAISEVLQQANIISGVVPQIAVVLGSCVGSPAVIASNSDIVITVEDAEYYLNPNDDSICGDIVVEDADAAVEKVKNILDIVPSNNLETSVIFDVADVSMRECDGVSSIVDAICDGGEYVEIGEGKNKTVLTRIGGVACGVVTFEKEKICCCAASKIAQFVRFCDAFSLPIITFVDSAGFKNIKSMSKVSHAYAEATASKITVIAGKAYGSVYIATAGANSGADVVYAWEDAVILPIAPEAAIYIYEQNRLENLKDPKADREKLAEEYAKDNGSAPLAAQNGLVSDVISISDTKEYVVKSLEMLASKRVSRLSKKHSNICL